MDTGEAYDPIAAQYDYHPYGSQHANPELAASGNDYRFSGKEWQERFGVPYYDFGARLYDGIEWGSPDALSEKYPGIGPYVYCAGNPVNLIDPDGMRFTEAMDEAVGKLLERVKKLMASNKRKMKKLQNQLFSGDNNINQDMKATEKIGGLQLTNHELDQVNIEAEVLKNSDQLYDVQYGIAPESSSMDILGETVYNTETDALTINIYDIGTSDVTFVHEMKHLYQFEIGKLSYRKKDGTAGYYYDYEDEVEAHRRGSVLGGPPTPASSYRKMLKNSAPGPIPASAITIQRIMETQIFRLNNITYR